MTDLFGNAPAAVPAASPAPAGLTAEQQRKLDRIANIRTAYEAVLVHPDGRKVLLAYCQRHSKAGLREAVWKRGKAVVAFLGLSEDAEMRWPRGKQEIVFDGGGVVRWSGRTQRDAIMAGDELPYVGRLAAA